MNDLTVYALYDRVGIRYRSITVDDPKPEVAKRNLAYAVNRDPQLMFMCKDFDFVKIAEFDSASGVITPVIPGQVICHVSELSGVNLDKEIV